MFHHDPGIHGWYMVLAWVLALIVLIIIIWLVVKARRPRQKTEFQTEGKSPLDILKERYAKGEIDHEEYEQRKKNLD